MAFQEQAALAIVDAMERAVDDELERIDNMDDEDISAIRNKRIKQLKEMSKRREEWTRKGHGRYTEMQDPKEFFDAAKGSERVCCHFHRSSTERCKIVEARMREVAQKHFETRFIAVDVEKLSMLAERFNVMMLPTIMLIEGGKTFHSIIGLDDFGGDEFDADTMAQVLAHHGMVNDRGMFDNDQEDD